MKGYSAIARALSDAGVEVMFGLIGDANMYFVADYVRQGFGTYIGAAVENGAVSMAHGYARVSGKVGVVTVTHGPGAANTINPVVEAARSHTPLVLITGRTPGTRGHPQDIDLRALYSATGAVYHCVLQVEHLVEEVVRVIATAANTRRPIVLDIPFELHHGDVEYAGAVMPPRFGSAMEAPEAQIDEALGMLVNANRPLLLAGRGALESGAGEALIALADHLGAPLATTASAKDLFVGHPYNIGVMGESGLDWATDIIVKADCIVAFGASLGRYTTMDGELLPTRSVIQVEIAPESVGRLHVPDLTVSGDAKVVAEVMVGQIQELGDVDSGFRTSVLGAGVLGRDPLDGLTDRSAEDTVDMRSAMVALDEIVPTDRVLVTDGGRSTAIAWRYAHVSDARNFVHTYAWGSIGLGTATAIGAAIARRDLPTICVTGDGGLMMGLIEFSTAIREHLSLVVVVMNDGAYGEEYDKFVSNGFDASFCFNKWPDFAPIAQAMGGLGRTVRSREEFRSALSCALESKEPALIDVRVSPHVNPKLP